MSPGRVLFRPSVKKGKHECAGLYAERWEDGLTWQCDECDQIWVVRDYGKHGKYNLTFHPETPKEKRARERCD